jgi:hypothetical protein
MLEKSAAILTCCSYCSLKLVKMEMKRVFLFLCLAQTDFALSAGGVALSSRAQPACAPAGITGLACRPSALRARARPLTAAPW